jgi:hypothetical protein
LFALAAAIPHDAHVAGRGRVEGIESGGGAVVGRGPVTGEERAPAALDADAGIARGRGAGARVGRQRAFDLEQHTQAICQFLAAAHAEHRAVIRQARAGLAAMHAHGFEAQVQAAVQLQGVGLGETRGRYQAEEGGAEDRRFHGHKGQLEAPDVSKRPST